MANVQKLCFDFERQYLKDVISWGDDLCDPDVLLPKFVDNEFDGEIVYLIFSGLQVVVTIATYVSGISRSIGARRYRRSENVEEDGWQLTEDGRIWSGTDLEVVKKEQSSDSKKLAKLLKSQIEAMSKLERQRKEVVKGFAKFETDKTTSRQKNIFSKARKLDVKVQKYLKLMETESQLRRQIIQKLQPESRHLSTRHKKLLALMIKNLRRFTRSFITDGDEPDLKELSGRGDNISVGSRNEEQDMESQNLLHLDDEEKSPNVSRRSIS